MKKTLLAKSLLSIALLIGSVTILPAQSVPPPAGLVSWWPGEGNANDVNGTNNGVLEGGLGFGTGEVGQAFNFTTTNMDVKVPASPSIDVGKSNGFTIECWINPKTANSSMPLVEWNNAANSWGAHFHILSGGVLAANLVDTSGNWHSFSSAGVLLSNVWQHVALTYDKTSGLAKYYRNGIMVAQSGLGSFTAQTTYNLYIGRRVSAGPGDPLITYSGLIDEVSLYSRALTSNEVASIYTAGNSGKTTNPPSLIPPSINIQPVDQTVASGTNVTLSVLASGSAPLSYQWWKGVTGLNGKTNSSLSLLNAQVADSGTYYVVVTNLAGSITSSNAVLTVTNVPVVPVTISGLVSWWPGESNANDVIGPNNGVLEGSLGFGTGEVGQAFNFTTTNMDVKVPASASLDVGKTNGFTIECWINPKTVSSSMPLVEWNNASNSWGAHFHILNGGVLAANIVDTSGNWHSFSSGGVVLSNVWQHVALSYDKNSGLAKYYRNGIMVAQSGLGSFTAQTTYNLYIGPRVSAGPGDPLITYSGLIDEVSLYNRALTTNEIASIYNAGSSGKTPPTPPLTPPSIDTQPVGQTVASGTDVTLSVLASGSAPLSYQWWKGVTGLNGKTNSTLPLLNAQVADTGTYHVVVTNLAGSIISSNAVVTVTNVPVAPTGTCVSEIVYSSLVNGSFEDGLNGWSSTPGMYVIGPDIGVDGDYSGDLGGGNIANTKVWQSVTAIPGSTYQLSFYSAANADPGLVAVGRVEVEDTYGVIVASETFTNTSTGSAYDTNQFTLHSLQFTVSTNASCMTVRFLDLTPGGGIAIDVAIDHVVLGLVTTPVVSGLVSWWPGEGNANDIIGPNNGVLEGGLGFGAGEVGQAFNFTTNSQRVRVPASASLDVGTGNGFTVEAWVNPSTKAVNGLSPIVEWNNGVGSWGAHFYIIERNLMANIVDTSGNWHPFNTGGNTVTSNVWQHVALSYDKPSGVATYYYNGLMVFQENIGQFTPQTSYDLYLGHRPLSGTETYTFDGLLDEVSLYNRALSSNEIADIYHAGNGGKTPPLPVPPSIVTQPTNQTVNVGQTVDISVIASGSPVLQYQWSFNSTPIDGATNATLTLADVQLSQAGDYAVVVTNLFGSIQSDNATITVVVPGPAAVRIASTSVISGLPVDVPVELVAVGNENALAFSLTFDPAQLTPVDATLPDGSDALLLINSDHMADGKLGFAVVLPPEETFLAGTQQILLLRFTTSVLAGTQSVETPLIFTDDPTIRELSDADALPLPATYSDGTVTLLPTAYEADVASRPYGNQSLSITDMVEVGRLLAGIDDIGSESEFQRTDCAPREDLGDGELKATDWVQAGRYAIGLDPMTIAGGPTSPVSESSLKKSVMKKAYTGSRQVFMSDEATVQGLTVIIPVSLASQGDESALAFSLSFDPAVLSYQSTAKGSAAGAATLNVNAKGAADGKLTMALMLPTGTHFAAGTKELVKITFKALQATTNYALSFAGQSTPSISDVHANELGATYVASAVTVNPPPPLSISTVGNNVVLKWPVWAAGFTLQSANPVFPLSWSTPIVTLQTNGATVETTVPATPQPQFFRLQHP